MPGPGAAGCVWGCLSKCGFLVHPDLEGRVIHACGGGWYSMSETRGHTQSVFSPHSVVKKCPNLRLQCQIVAVLLFSVAVLNVLNHCLCSNLTSYFELSPSFAQYFVIKSYTTLKYEIWSSTEPGNKRLDKAFEEYRGRRPIYLFISINTSGHFCVMPIDHTQSSTMRVSDKWKACSNVSLSLSHILDFALPACGGQSNTSNFLPLHALENQDCDSSTHTAVRHPPRPAVPREVTAHASRELKSLVQG
ncbi:hypothetical protein B0H17DRAFT_1144420 [Mycena rosella]|uniref:YTH domain-containing protein n=1 Tax=Mycena rosella TaxID=1033263 RepID=A0AAD7G2Y7_MYCRO|nr:hypothetical protein B0H17DRAFT_1144420 [Mycena rosella]